MKERRKMADKNFKRGGRDCWKPDCEFLDREMKRSRRRLTPYGLQRMSTRKPASQDF